MTMKRISILCLCALIPLVNGCKKELPKVEDPGNPVFYAKCNVNGIPLSITAGLDNYVMNSSYYLDENNLYVYKSQFKQKSCSSGCGYEFTVLINNSAFSDDSTVSLDPDRSLATGNYLFGNGSSAPKGWTCSFWPTNTAANTTYDWYFSDGISMTGAAITRTMAPDVKYSLAMYSDNGDCSNNFDNAFRLGNYAYTNISVETISTLRYRFSANEGNKPPYQYNWNFGDNTAVSKEKNPTHTYGTNATYIATLTLVDGDNDTCVWRYQVVPPNSCDANFTCSFSPIKNTAALSTITLLMKDPDGKVYSSAEINQAGGSGFEILSTSEYEVNENNQKTRKIKIRFNCDIKDGTNTLKITNGEAVIAAAYK